MPPVWDECAQVVRSVRGPVRGELFDVGCGNGSYLEVMRALGWRVRGLEPDPVAARIARGRGFDVIERSIEEADIPQERSEERRVGKECRARGWAEQLRQRE